MTILPPIYGFSEQLRRLADGIPCHCQIHRKIKASLYYIAKTAEENPATLIHISRHKNPKKRERL